MMRDVKSFKVSIGGSLYTLRSDDDEGMVRESASYVDELMREVCKKLPHESTDRIAVYVALKLAHSLKLLENEQRTNLKAQSELVALIDQQLSERG